MGSRFRLRRVSLVVLLLCKLSVISAQNYHAVQGSPYAGSMGVVNNPASILMAPHPWDVTIFSQQAEASTNAIVIHNYSLLSSPKKSSFTINNGDYSRFANINFNTHLLNARVAIDRKHAFAFGVNLRGYGRIKTSPYNFVDTIQSLNNFFGMNENTSKWKGNFTGSSWLEVFGTYSQTIFDNSDNRLNAGITVKVMRGIAGGFTQIGDVTVEKTIHDNHPIYSINGGTLRYGYSSNFDEWQNNKTTHQNINDFIHNSKTGFAVDLGVEYLIKPEAVTRWYDDDYFDYDWKISVSLLDLGYNQYAFSRQSRKMTNGSGRITDDTLVNKFINITGIQSFNDSLAGIATTISPLQGRFNVLNPARLVVNVDRYLNNHFYLNGEVSLNLSSIINRNGLYVQDMNLLTITPRWETMRLGFYLPLQLTTDGLFWAGAACKLGPLLLGVHNLNNIFSKNKMQNGGAYVALVITPFNLTKIKTDKRLDCPKPK